MEKRLKTIAMYLPQFHRIPENDEWWGEGYTDWVATKQAEPLFEGHRQPRIPLEHYYYDLLDPGTMRWQADLAKEYGIDGFCLYHYYFKDGKKLLEKPAEILLADKNIDIDYCFCWANETWARSWAKLYHSNMWAEKYEQDNLSHNEILLSQEYGDKKDWREHFEYLLPFFKDERYIKKMNKPVFLVYHPEDIPMFSEMFSYFNEWCMEEGFSGIYTIGTNITRQMECMDAVAFVHFVDDILGIPANYEIRNGVRIREYDEVWKRMLALPKIGELQTYYGGFVDRDTTPRKGAQGLCIVGGSPKGFADNLFSLAVKNLHYGNEYLFIDAWNEWGEGNYLEPDMGNRYGYLEAVYRVMNEVNSEEFSIESEWIKLTFEEEKNDYYNNLQLNLDKYRVYYKILDRWLRLNELGKTPTSFFYNNGIATILIYGYMSLANHLAFSLDDSDVHVLGFIDRRDGYKAEKYPVYNLERGFPKCDAIVVTPMYDYDSIRRSLEQKTDARIVSIEEVIFGVEID